METIEMSHSGWMDEDVGCVGVCVGVCVCVCVWVCTTSISVMEDLCSVAQSCPTPRPHDCSMPGFLVLHYLPAFAQIHVQWVSQWCHPIISSFVAPFSSCPQSFPASESFPMSWLFASGDQSIRASASAAVLPLNNGILLSHKKEWNPVICNNIDGSWMKISEINLSEEDQYDMILLICGI